MPDPKHAFACDLSAFSPEERARHGELVKLLFGSVESVVEQADGYAFRLAPRSTPSLAVEFIAQEQRCCPFFSFTLHVLPAGHEVWLGLSGPPGVKPFILAEIGHALPADVQRSLAQIHDRLDNA